MPDKKPALKDLKVEDIMTANVYCVLPTMTIKEIVKLFLDKAISGAPIVDQGNKVISVVSQSDLIQFLAMGGMGKPINGFLSKLPTAEHVIRVNKHDHFKEVFKQFLTNPVRRIIVTDGNGHLQGLVSKSNLLRAFMNAEDGKGETKAQGPAA